MQCPYRTAQLWRPSLKVLLDKRLAVAQRPTLAQLRVKRLRPLCASHTGRKAAVKTTEFAVYLAAVAGVLIASFLVGDADGRGDVFLADKAWFYVTLLTIGYLISRGLAKAGSRAHHNA
jgi:hypothetical protein